MCNVDPHFVFELEYALAGPTTRDRELDCTRKKP
jgi:hypothetical protein